MKKIILLISILFSLSSVCFAQTPPLTAENTSQQIPHKKTIAMFLEAPSSFAMNDTTKDLLIRKVKILFPSERFYVLPLETTNNTIKSHRPTNHFTNIYSSQLLNNEDIFNMSKELNCDYAFLMTISKGLPSMSADFNSSTYKTSVNCEFKILSVQAGSYIVSKKINKEISSDTMKEVSENNHVYSDALEGALLELNINISNL